MTRNPVGAADKHIHDAMHRPVLENEFSFAPTVFTNAQRILHQDQLASVHLNSRMVIRAKTNFQIAGEVSPGGNKYAAISVYFRSLDRSRQAIRPMLPLSPRPFAGGPTGIIFRWVRLQDNRTGQDETYRSENHDGRHLQTSHVSFRTHLKKIMVG